MGKAENGSPYPRLLMAALPRALTLQDRNRASRTWGCCDRGFWNYRTLTDAPSATFQQLMLAQAVAFKGLPGNPYAGKASLLQNVAGALRFWADSQHASGAFDEWYRNEHSYCATAFTAYGAAETALLLGEELDSEARAKTGQALTRAAKWLSTRFNPTVMNQNLAACCALWNVSQFLEEDWIRRAFQATWERTVATQHEEGWFPEYGGADVGYSTLALDLLAVLDRRGAEVGDAPKNLARFLANFVAGSHGFGEPLGSRGTGHAFPYGAEYFAALGDANARRVASALRARYRGPLGVDPGTVDDRYFSYFYLPQFALAATVDAGAPEPETEAETADVDLPAAGFRIWRVGETGVVVSLRRQAAFAVHRGEHSEVHLGFWAQTQAGERWSSCGFRDSAAMVHPGPDPRHVTGCGPFCRVEDSLPLVRWGWLFQGMTRGALRFSTVAEGFQRWIKKRKIETRRDAPLWFERSLRIEGEQLEVRDRIAKKTGCPPLEAIYPVSDIDVHSPSARMASRAALAASADPERAREHARTVNEHGQVEILTRVALR